MKLNVICSECGRKINVRSFAQDRVELSRIIGEDINLKCGKCGNEKKYHVNKVTASTSELLSIFMFIFVFVLSIYIGYYLIMHYWG